ncbi:MAG: BrnT family toxin [Burkholderiales bacterium]
MTTIFEFEWDENKARANFNKHAVSFKQGEGVFRDPLALTIYDDEQSEDEDRWITIGMAAPHQYLVVVHTFAEKSPGSIHVRILSTRGADPDEIKDYQETPR